MIGLMPTITPAATGDPTFDLGLVRPRGKVLARADRELKARLVQMRRDAGLTQKQLAERIGISQQAIQKLERYDSDPRMSTLRQYANAVEAIVEHRVVHDVGQSVWMAGPSQWESIMTMKVAQPTSLAEKAVTSGWGASARTSFALAS